MAFAMGKLLPTTSIVAEPSQALLFAISEAMSQSYLHGYAPHRRRWYNREREIVVLH
jgi:hypothetical protein